MDHHVNTEWEGLSHLKREFIAGGLAGSLGIFIGFPLDLVKVKLQAYPNLYKSAYQCFVQSVKQDGWLGLYNGCIPPILFQGECFRIGF
ncbi:solute carrier family 25 protein [archaeon]|nr:MAG: solute carrier family 25 protein [archaeon]